METRCMDPRAWVTGFRDAMGSHKCAVTGGGGGIAGGEGGLGLSCSMLALALAFLTCSAVLWRLFPFVNLRHLAQNLATTWSL